MALQSLTLDAFADATGTLLWREDGKRLVIQVFTERWATPMRVHDAAGGGYD